MTLGLRCVPLFAREARVCRSGCGIQRIYQVGHAVSKFNYNCKVEAT